MGTPLNDPAIGSPDAKSVIHKTDMNVRCRKCESCTKAKAKHWSARCRFELDTSFRTWFLTLTWPEDDHIRRAWAHDLDMQNPADFQYMAQLCLKDVTKMFKRMRKAGRRFRYMQVVEQHKNGFPHVHMLLHECSIKTFSRRDLGSSHGKMSRFWPHISNATLVRSEKQAPWYVLGYLHKTPQTRMRASLGYGKPHKRLPPASVNEHLRALRRQASEAQRE